MNDPFVETPFTDNSIPYYYQIANLLRQRIEHGDLTPGVKLPNEMDLAKMFGVSRVPIRQALSLLETDGLILRQHGRGTFVAEDIKKLQVVKLTGIVGWDIPTGTEHRLLTIEDISPNSHLAKFFELSQSDRITRFRRLRMMEEIPLCYIMNYLPVEIAKRIKKADFRKNPMMDIVKKRLRIVPGKIHQTIQAIAADNEVATNLQIGSLGPVMYVETFGHDKKGKPVLYTQTFYRGDLSKYSIEMQT